MKQVIIIGGGASGVAAAIRLADLNRNVNILILEKNERILKKLLTTGGGKCNITNTAVTPAVYDSRFAHPVTAKYDFETVRAFLASLSLPIKADDKGRCYPLSESAKNAVNLLLSALEQRNITVKTGITVKNIQKKGDTFTVQADSTYTADAVITAVGSAASVKGYNGLDLLHNTGFKMNRPAPALCPIPSDEAFLKELKGVRVKGSITLRDKTESGEIQFNESNVSGICAFNLAKYVKNGDTLTLNFNTSLSADELYHGIQTVAEKVNENTKLLDFLLVRKLALVILKRAGVKPSGNPKELNETQIQNIVNQIIRFTVRVHQPTDYKNAQTVCGGLNEKQVSPETLESLRHKGLYFCGEILDADAPCGGFNLHWAWASGLCAADNANLFLNGENH